MTLRNNGWFNQKFAVNFSIKFPYNHISVCAKKIKLYQILFIKHFCSFGYLMFKVSIDFKKFIFCYSIDKDLEPENN